MTNSKEYLPAQGGVEGRTGALRIQGVQLRFPPAFLRNSYSTGSIVHGQADSVATHLGRHSSLDRYAGEAGFTSYRRPIGLNHARQEAA